MLGAPFLQEGANTMSIPIVFADLLRQVATAINTEARHAGMSPEQADDLIARVLTRLGVDTQTIADLRHTKIQRSDNAAE